MENTRIYLKHKDCPVEAIPGPFGIHYAKLICSCHGTWIQWLNKSQYQQIQKG
jgi:hypothetical protein